MAISHNFASPVMIPWLAGVLTPQASLSSTRANILSAWDGCQRLAADMVIVASHLNKMGWGVKGGGGEEEEVAGTKAVQGAPGWGGAVDGTALVKLALKLRYTA